MALCTLSFNSTVLKRPEKIEILIPQDGFKASGRKMISAYFSSFTGFIRTGRSGCWTPSCPFSCGSCP